MKAFLSHSWSDKELVKSVAELLGRQFCIIDDTAFSTGDEFKSSIEKSLNNTSIFVLFASKNSLKSVWVNFEIEEAWYKKLVGIISKSLIYIIDSSIDYSNLPEWLTRRTIVRKEISAQAIARDIRLHIDNLLKERQRPFFLGRTQQIQELENVILPIDGSTPPRAFFITGLPGIGRRSLILNSTPRLLNFSKHVEIRVESGDSITDLCIRIADRVEPFSTQKGLKKLIEDIKSLTDDQACIRIITNMQTMAKNSELPIFFDEGGLLDSEGYVQQPINSILQFLDTTKDLYLFLVSSRKPHFHEAVSYPIIHVPPFTEQDSKRLITAFANSLSVTIGDEKVSELSEYVEGYPPAIYYAVRQVKEYGPDLVIRDKRQLRQFLKRVFLKHLQDANLSDAQADTIRLLSAFSPLPYEVIDGVLGISIEDVIYLIDLSLIMTTEIGYYRISDPVIDAAVSVFGFPSSSDLEALAKVLNKYLKRVIEGPRIELSSVLFRIAKFTNNDELAKNAYFLASDLIRLTEMLYHERKYLEAIKVGRMAIAERPENAHARSYLIRALIQQENWNEAQSQINALKQYAPLYDVKFLSGFLERKREKIRDAISFYEEARRLGRGGASIFRELALCYYTIDNQKKAAEYIQEALTLHGDNKYVVDLWAQIATRQRDEKAARQALERLERIDNLSYYYHRLSKVEFAFGNQTAAKIAARRAFEEYTRPPFEILVQLIICEIATNNLGEADDLLQKIKTEYGNIRLDIQIGLRCRIEIARGNYKDALEQSERIVRKNLYYKAIRKDALFGELNHSALSDEIRNAYQEECKILDQELQSQPIEKLLPIDFDFSA